LGDSGLTIISTRLSQKAVQRYCISGTPALERPNADPTR
jgi:hypothetical protein